MAGKIETWGNALYTGQKNYKIVQKGKYFMIVSGALCALALLAVLIFGFNLGIEFKGGSEITVPGVQDQSQQVAIDAIHEVDAKEEPIVTAVGSSSLKIQTATITDNEKVDELKNKLAEIYEVDASTITVNSIGPSWGADLSSKAVYGLIVFLVLVAVFMTVYFGNWKMASAALIALFHDLIMTVGIYALVGWEITPASMIGFLTVLGYSMYDTVVVFDKVHENTDGVFEQSRSTYGELSNLAVNQTLVRSINTSVVTLLPVGSILAVGVFVMGSGTLRDIALALFVGMFAGTYSSIFLATPMSVYFRSNEKKIKDHNALVMEKREKLAESAGISADSEEFKQFETPNIKLLPGEHLGMKAHRGKRKRK